jgi:hypothetical protein
MPFFSRYASRGGVSEFMPISILSNGGVCFKYYVFGETFIRIGWINRPSEKVMI